MLPNNSRCQATNVAIMTLPGSATEIDFRSPVVRVQRFAVEFSYAVAFTEHLFDPANAVFADALARLEPERRHRFVALIEAGIAAAWPDLPDEIAAYAARHDRQLELAGPPEIVPGGEGAKNDPALVERLQRRLLALGIDRHSYVVAIGGGAMLDMVGFVAATTHRGVRLVRVPTTVLGQLDSGVGVKNGINAFGVKNFIGTFAPPFAVLNDARFLSSLPARDRIAGLAEAVKVALIRDRVFFEWLERRAEDAARAEPDALAFAIRRCADLHMRHICTAGDPFEMGSARPLDFGHWAAHKLETMTGHALRHGEAVAIGIALDTRYSVQAGLLAPGSEERVCRLLERLGLRLWHDALEARAADGSYAVLGGLRDFREHLGGELTVTLLAEIGRGVEVHEMDEAAIIDAIGWLKQRDACR